MFSGSFYFIFFSFPLFLVMHFIPKHFMWYNFILVARYSHQAKSQICFYGWPTLKVIPCQIHLTYCILYFQSVMADVTNLFPSSPTFQLHHLVIFDAKNYLFCAHYFIFVIFLYLFFHLSYELLFSQEKEKCV